MIPLPFGTRQFHVKQFLDFIIASDYVFEIWDGKWVEDGKQRAVVFFIPKWIILSISVIGSILISWFSMIHCKKNTILSTSLLFTWICKTSSIFNIVGGCNTAILLSTNVLYDEMTLQSNIYLCLVTPKNSPRPVGDYSVQLPPSWYGKKGLFAYYESTKPNIISVYQLPQLRKTWCRSAKKRNHDLLTKKPSTGWMQGFWQPQDLL